MGDVLRRLGYRAHLGCSRHGQLLDYVQDTGNAPRSDSGLGDDFMTPSTFFVRPPARSGRDPHATVEPLAVLRPRAWTLTYDAALAARGTEANARWAALDRRVTAAAPVVPLFNRRTVMLVSHRAGNAPTHQLLGPLLDQFWVR